MKLLTFPFRLLFKLVVLPIKLVFATLGFGMKTGAKATALPFRGGYRASRALGLKAIVLFVLGAAVGVAIGRRLGAAGAEVSSSFGGAYGSDGDSGPAAVASITEDSIEMVDTPDGPVVALVEDTIEVVETPDGEVVTETVSITEIDPAATAAEEAAQEAADELEAEVDIALGETGGELGVDADAGDDGNR